MIFNDIFNKELEDIEWRKYWEELGVNFSKINENKELNKIIRSKVESLCKVDLKILSEILNINYDDECIENILEHNEISNIVYVDNFLKRKKKAVDELYDYIFIKTKEYNEEASSIIKLFQLFLDKNIRLFEIYALNEWISKGTGIEYISNSDLSQERIGDFLKENELEKFCEFMKETPQIGTSYKVRMICKYNTKQIFVVYKLKNDTQMSDFDRAKRVKNIEKILFEIDINKGILHIRYRNYSERIQIKKFFENYFDVEFKEIETEVFSDYDVSDFKENFSSLSAINKERIANFYITKITFLNSLLDKSPEVTFDAQKRDVWPSVVHAFNMKIIDIDTLDAIKNMNVNVNDRFRTIRTIRFKDGNIIFKLDDKGIKEEERKVIENKFREKFKVPLNIRIKNKLEKGEIEQIDSILRCVNADEIREDRKIYLDSLLKNNIVKTQKVNRFICSNEACGHIYEYVDEEIEKCSECFSDEFAVQEYTKLEVNSNKIEQYIRTYLCETLNIDNKYIEKSDKYKEYTCLRFIYNEKEHNVIITNKIISKKTIKSIEKKLIPTIVVYYGIDNEQAKLMTPNSIEMVEFGRLYSNIQNLKDENNILESIFASLEKMLHYQIVNAAMLANEDLENIKGEPSSISKGYSATDFEDDIYALLKDIIFNSEKWGASDIGKPLPEGVLTFQYTEPCGSNEIEYRVAFTFDCKLTSKDSGYDLGMSEKRKAIDYVNKFNKANEIHRYCTNKELSSHIFISNKFKESQIEQVVTYFKESISQGNNTMPAFIDFRGLLKFHSWYRIHYEAIQKNRNYFYKRLFDIFTIGKNIINYEDFKELIDDLEECFEDDKKINLKRMKEKILKK